MTERRRLDSWKEIAEFLGRSTRTVQRWHRESGLPVHQVPGSGRGPVFAFTDELTAWLHHPKGLAVLNAGVLEKPGRERLAEVPDHPAERSTPPFSSTERAGAGITRRPDESRSITDEQAPGLALQPPEAASNPSREGEPHAGEGDGCGHSPDPAGRKDSGNGRGTAGGPEPDVPSLTGPRGRNEGPAFWRKRSRGTALAVITLLLAAGSGTCWILRLRDQDPSSGAPLAGRRIQTAGHELSLLEPDGTPVWRRQFKEPLYDEARFSKCANLFYFEQSYRFQRFQDLDGDGRWEILVITGWTRSNRVGPAVLHCLDAAGQTRWTFRPGQPMRFGSGRFDENWIIRYFMVEDFNGDGRPEILVNANHHSDYPARLCLLDCRGKLLAGFVNSGWVNQTLWLEPALPGHRELLCAAANNGYQTGALFILDPSTMAGASPQPDTPDYHCPDLPCSQPLFYMLFPRDCLCRLKRNFGIVRVVRRGLDPFMLQASSIFGHRDTEGEIHYLTGKDLTIEDIQASNQYIAIHDACFREGLLDHSFTPSELRRLEPARYWDGRRFITSPARNRFWQK